MLGERIWLPLVGPQLGAGPIFGKLSVVTSHLGLSVTRIIEWRSGLLPEITVSLPTNRTFWEAVDQMPVFWVRGPGNRPGQRPVFIYDPATVRRCVRLLTARRSCSRETLPSEAMPGVAGTGKRAAAGPDPSDDTCRSRPLVKCRVSIILQCCHC